MPACQQRIPAFLLPTVILLFMASASAAPTAQRHVYEMEQVRLHLLARTPRQVQAFYEARGFPPPALAEMAKTCFITVSIHNRGRSVLWHDLNGWTFRSGERKLQRYTRDYWQERWKKLNIRAGLRATFRWTLLPETLDFQPDEREGGNIILPRGTRPIQIEAVFHTGPAGGGKTLRVKTGDITCATDA